MGRENDTSSGVGADDEDDLVGRTIGKYKLVRLLGVGGMGRVYEGVHATLGRRMAFKFIDPGSATPDAVLRFQREAQAASAVDSAHIVEINDVGTTEDGRHYIVMELLRGEDLGQLIRREGKVGIPEALRIAAQVLRGLVRAHDAGIVHRDLKPDNVFLVERDDDPCFAKVLDFGVSKIQKRGDTSLKTLTREGVVLGTPLYMSPEQAQALPEVDGRSDLWSVGAILFESLTGRSPHTGATYEQVIVNICTRDVDDVRKHNAEVSEEIAAVVKRALQRDRDARYASARDMLDALVAASDGALPISLNSESLAASDNKRRAAVSRPGSATLGAVSTVAVNHNPSVTKVSAAVAPQGRERHYKAAGVVAIGCGLALIGAIYYVGTDGPNPAATAPVPTTGPPREDVVPTSNAPPEIAPPVKAEASAVPSVSAQASAVPSVSGAPSASPSGKEAPSGSMGARKASATPLVTKAPPPDPPPNPPEADPEDGLRIKRSKP